MPYDTVRSFATIMSLALKSMAGLGRLLGKHQATQQQGILMQFGQRLLGFWWQQPSSPLLAPIPTAAPAVTPLSTTTPSWQEALWLAVPKQKVTRHKKRLKTTVQKRIRLRKDIIADPRTGETTLRHKLPFNWKDYLPKVE